MFTASLCDDFHSFRQNKQAHLLRGSGGLGYVGGLSFKVRGQLGFRCHRRAGDVTKIKLDEESFMRALSFQGRE